MAKPFVSEASLAVADAEALVGGLAAYWAGYDVEVETVGSCVTARLGLGSGVLEPDGERLKLRLEAEDLGKLELLRSYATETLCGFLKDEALVIDWRGHMATGATFADFREVRLVSNVPVAPRVRRLTFTGSDVARFGSEADLHVRLYFPPDGLETPEWPRPGPDGRTIWPADDRRPEVRYYTVRRFLPQRDELEIDFVIHADEGPGSAFAARARPGAVCGMAGPLGRGAPAAGWTLLAGDETALPAIARILERMPRDACGAAFIEIDSAVDEMAIDHPSGVALRWLYRRGAPAGATDLLFQAVASAHLPPDADPFVWVACEYSASKAIRKHLRATRGLARDRHLVVGYWQRDMVEAAA
ncbi:siderophore-interacting protein [Hansschlegelia zhihuaiae]|uniref:Siderophore-interacting protein n=1 Tax=Hansschlegelia zhihuaiae TaxID=405005 RepID=A0A4Q0M403_9HYPH|nr:siderophore-interacting protein [Hansschlegelia zhihuaiae]RXF67419.1 siderophore-interacting protein [Hansschlegelia zhihuaiae]